MTTESAALSSYEKLKIENQKLREVVEAARRSTKCVICGNGWTDTRCTFPAHIRMRKLLSNV